MDGAISIGKNGVITNGNFSTEDVPEGNHVVTFNGNGYYPTTVKLEVKGNGTIQYNQTLYALPSDFPMEFFDRVARATFRGRDLEIQDGTARWMSQPTVYVDKESLYTQISNRFVADFLIREIRNTLVNYAHEVTNGFMRYRLNPDGTVDGLVEVERSSDMPKKERDADAVIIKAIPATPGVGAFQRVYYAGRNVIVSGTLELTPNAGRSTVVQDLCQILAGIAVDYPGSGSDSIYYDEPRFENPDVNFRPTDKDKKMSVAIYGKPEDNWNMPPGIRPPFDFSHLMILSGTPTGQTQKTSTQTISSPKPKSIDMDMLEDSMDGRFIEKPPQLNPIYR